MRRVRPTHHGAGRGGGVVDLVALAEVLNANGGVGGHVGYRRIVLSA